jgi:hypothetical protein
MQISEEKAQEVTMHERRIEQTRGAMADTVSELQDRLSPGAIAGNAGNAVKDATVGRSGRFVSQLGDRIKENPLPAALIGSGLAWMWLSGRKKKDDGQDYYYSRGLSSSPRSTYTSGGPVDRAKGQVSDAVGNAGDQVSGAVSDAADRVSGTMSDAADMARNQVDQLGWQARRVQNSFQQMFEENPLPIALAAAGLGALVASAVPTTDTEQRIMEPVGQQLSEQAKTLGDKVGQVAQQAKSSAKDEAQRQHLTSP